MDGSDIDDELRELLELQKYKPFSVAPKPMLYREYDLNLAAWQNDKTEPLERRRAEVRSRILYKLIGMLDIGVSFDGVSGIGDLILHQFNHAVAQHVRTVPDPQMNAESSREEEKLTCFIDNETLLLFTTLGLCRCLEIGRDREEAVKLLNQLRTRLNDF